MLGISGVAPDIWSIDSVTLLLAIISAGVTAGIRLWRGIAPAVTRRKIIVDFLNGSVVYPFVLLVFSVVNSGVFKYIETSKISVGLAGVVGIIFIAGELLISCSPERPASVPNPQPPTP
jgi:uncharacterized membrane protein (DUF373 family)